MTRINKQRFLPELGKLLTFMDEEDRQAALNLYSKCFDDAEDEQQLMDLLVSPTRQAVVIARSYDTKDRKRVKQSADGDEQVPAFVLAIDKIYQQIAPRRERSWDSIRAEDPAEPPAVDQFSLFPDEPHPIDDSEYLPFRIDAEAVSLDDAADAPAPADAAAVAPAEPEAQPAAAEPPFFPEDEEPGDDVFVSDAEELPVRELDYALLEQEPLAPAPGSQTSEQQAVSFAHAELEPEQALSSKRSAADFDLDFVPETRRKTRVFLLILYILLAIPVALVGIVVLLIPALIALALAVGVIVLGSAALVAAFSLFQQLADLLILLGTAIIVLALGLLLLWLFVWFLGGAIGGLIRGLVDLGRKWCFVEVPV